jgi:hypothetical protein
MRNRFGCRTTPLRKAQDFEFGDHPLQRQTQTIAYAHAVRGLNPFRIQMDFAAIDGRGRETARFEEPRVPQPFVQTMAIAFLA